MTVYEFGRNSDGFCFRLIILICADMFYRITCPVAKTIWLVYNFIELSFFIGNEFQVLNHFFLSNMGFFYSHIFYTKYDEFSIKYRICGFIEFCIQLKFGFLLYREYVMYINKYNRMVSQNNLIKFNTN